jgi:hypothetical protein
MYEELKYTDMAIKEREEFQKPKNQNFIPKVINTEL